jgi:serine/threonine-protein kinase
MPLAENSVVDGRYRVLSRIGSGGMADVWLAEDTELGRKVALKVLTDRFAQDAEFVERFRREAHSAAALRHPNVVNIFDRGEFDGTYYIAMEYVEGSSLKDLIRQGLSVEEAVEIIRQVLGAAKHAHEQGIVHRDLKPANVLIDREGRAAVADFGIARAGMSEITQAGAVMGTAQYLSPEQAQGLQVTAASDLYSIGVMLYEALTGRVPFEGESAVAVAMKQVSEAPQPPSHFNPAVSRALDGVVLKALAKDPANRFTNAEQFSEALDAAEADPTTVRVGDTAVFGAAPVPVPAAEAQAPPPEGPPAEEEKDRHPWRWALLALLVAALAGFGIWTLTRPSQVTVPNVTGQKVEGATATLEDKGFEVATTPFPTAEQPVGTVIEQDPSAAEKADDGSTVTLTVASSPGKARVPAVTGLPLKQAIKKVRKTGFAFKTEQRFSDRIDSGDAIGTDPEEGTRVKRGSRVIILISKGANTVQVPSVIGEQQDIAESEVRRAGLVVNTEQRDSDEPEGQVIAQDPAGGSRVKKKSEVTLVVSSGAGSVILRDVEGQTKQSAVNTLRGQGLSVTVVTESTTDSSEDGRVIDEAPSPGTRLRKGDRVTITVGKFEPTTP